MRPTSDKYLALIQHVFRERSAALQWQVYQAASDAGLQDMDKLRRVFVENGGHIAQTARGTTEWRYGNRGGGGSTQHNFAKEPPSEGDSSATIQWMAQQRRTR